MTLANLPNIIEPGWRKCSPGFDARTVFGIVLLLNCACPSNDFPVTPPTSETAVVVILTDSNTGQPIDGARIVATDGSYTTALLAISGASGYYTGIYRSGTYRIDISADGYVSRSLENVEVKWGCDTPHPWSFRTGIPVSLDRQ